MQALHRKVKYGADAEGGIDPAGAARLGDGEVEPGQDPAGLFGERAPGVGRCDAAAAALEEIDAELVLEPSNCLGKRRLRYVQPLRGAAEVELLDHREEVAEQAKLNSIDVERRRGVGGRGLRHLAVWLWCKLTYTK